MPAFIVGTVFATGSVRLAQQLGPGSLFAVPASGRSALHQQHQRGSLVQRRAEEEVKDGKSEIVDGLKKTLNIKAENPVEAKFETPMDGILRNFLGVSAPEDPDDGFVDSGITSNYVTVELDRPFGIGLEEGDDDESLGASISEVQPDSNAGAAGVLAPGYVLIAANGKPVHALSFEDVLKEVSSLDGRVKLTFFVGGREFFYGKFSPSSQWLQDFLDDLSTAA